MKNKLITLPKVDFNQFKLVCEPTPEALASDVEKFHQISESGIDMHILGTFLSGVSLIKLKKIVGTASRGNTAKGEAGWEKFRENRFPAISSRSLLNYVNFAKAVFAEWQKGKSATVADLQIEAPADFQLPENPDELKGLLTAIHDAMDGKTITACYRSSGRIRDAQTPGTYERKPRDLRKEIDAAAEVDETAARSWISATLLLCAKDDPTLGEQKTAMLQKMERARLELGQRIGKLLKARGAKTI